jgi:hypothetical protein
MLWSGFVDASPVVCCERQEAIAAGATALQVLGVSSQSGQIAIADLERYCEELESTELLTERTLARLLGFV